MTNSKPMSLLSPVIAAAIQIERRGMVLEAWTRATITCLNEMLDK